MSNDQHKAHVKLQQSYFDLQADKFKQAIPLAIARRTRKIVRLASLAPESHILDVGTGVGVLIGHLIAVGMKAENITGCDLSSTMIKEAKAKYPSVMFWQGDVLDFPDILGAFNAIFFNACFGNFDNQDTVIQKATLIGCGQGQIVISHPMGAAFVEQLHANEPKIVPHILPDKDKLLAWAAQFSLTLKTYINKPNFYVAILQRSC